MHRRRGKSTSAERVLRSVENRLQQLEQVSTHLSARIVAAGDHGRRVETLQRDVLSVQSLARRVEDDLVAVLEGHTEMAQGRADVQRLLDALADVSARVAVVEAQNRPATRRSRDNNLRRAR
jgi:hypothetical protein